MANLLSNTTIGGYQSIHTGNIGSYAITSIPTSFSSITVTSSFNTASNDVYASMRVIRNDSAITDGMYIGYGNSGSGITRIFGGGSTGGALEKYATYTYEPGSFRAPIFYDSNDTNYYLDPNSTTALRTVGSWRADSSAWDGEFSGKIQYHSHHWYFQSGNMWYFRNAGGSNVFQVDQSGNGTFNGTVNANVLSSSEVSTRYFTQSTNGVPSNNLGNPTVTEMALFDEQFNNKTAFYNPASLTFWTSSDGTNFTEYTGFDTTTKKRFLGGDGDSGVVIPNQTNRFRIELENSAGYVFLNQLYIYWSSNSHITKVHIWVRRCDNNQWYQWTDSNTQVSSWPGHLYLPFNGIPFYPGYLASNGHFNKIRIEFIPTWSTGDYSTYPINLMRMQIWGGYPAGKRNIYTTDENQNVLFPAEVGSTAFYATDFRAANAFYLNGTSYFLNSTNGGIYTNARFETAGNLVVGGTTFLGNANGDEVHINDVLRLGATDSGDAHFFFGEGSSAGSDYGSHWYWDSGYTFTWNTRNAGTDTALFDYVTNDTTYVNWRRNFHMQDRAINYTGQLHFSGGTRFVAGDSYYLTFRADSASVGGIKVQDGNSTLRGYTGYFDSAGFGLLNSNGSWGIRLNPGNAETLLYYAGSERLRTDNSGAYVTGRLDVSSYVYTPGSIIANNIQGGYQVLSLDTIKNPGLYQYDGGIGGTQPLGVNWYNLRTIEIGNDGRYTQVAFPYSEDRAFFRRQTGATWGSWYEFIHSGNIGSQSVSYASTAGSANSVSWSNVSGRPTNVSSFTNDSGYYVNGTANTVNAFAVGYAQTNYNFSLAPRESIGSMSIKLWDNYFNGSGLGVDYGSLLDIYGRGGHVHSQFYMDASGGMWYRMSAYNGGWISWEKFITSSNYTTYAPSLTGSGASGTWGINITGTAARATRANGNFYIDDNYGNGIVGVYSASRYQGVFAMGDSYKLAADGTSTGNLYGLAWTHTNIGGQSKSGLEHQLLVMNYGVTQTAIGVGIWTAGLITTTSYGTSANWKAAYDWGNHSGLYLPISGGNATGWVRFSSSTQGTPIIKAVQEDTSTGYYLFQGMTGSSEVFRVDRAGNLVLGGAITAVGYNKGNWDTAYGWGNHASAGYLTGAHNHDDRYYTESESDGRFQPLENQRLSTGNSVTFSQVYTNNWFRNNSINTGLYQEAGGGNHWYAEDSNIWTIGANGNYPQIRFRSGGHQGGIRGYVYADYTNNIGFLSEDGNWVLRTWNRGVEAYGSMRAPIFYDSADTSYYLDPNASLSLKISGNIDLIARSASWAEGIRVRVPSTSTWGGIRFTRDRGNDDGNWAIGFTGIDSTDDLTFWANNSGDGGAMRLRMSKDGHVTAQSSLRAPIFYDSNDTSYYGDFASTSVMNAIRFGGSTNNGTLSAPSDWGVRVTTDAGYINFGPANGSYAHIYTDRPTFYFNKDILINGYSVITAANIGSQSVSYASTAGSAPANGGNSSTVGGYSVSVGASANTIPTRNASGYFIPESWIQLNGIYGLYSPTNGAHLRPNDASYGSWQMTGSRNGWQGIEFNSGSNGNVTMMIATDSRVVGFHNNSYGWQIRWDGGTLYIGKGVNGGTDATVLDSSNYSSWAQPAATAINTSNIGSQSVSYASSAGSVAWTNVSSRPTALSQFTNDLGNYGGWITSSGSITGNASKLDPLSGDSNYKLAYTADGARTNAGEWGRAVMYYVPNGQTYGIRVDRADYADSAGGVAWTNVSSRPTALSQFSNDLGNYGGWITSSGSISGNAATATNVAWSGVTSKPAGWLNEPNLIQDAEPSATAFPSGFYQSYLGAGNPTGTWFNYINVRHSNTNNGHGFQLGMSYYDTNLWFRSYQGGTSPSFSAWNYAIHSGNIGSQSVNYANSAGSATSATNAGQLNTYGYLVGENWNDYYTSGKLRVASVAGSTSANCPSNVHNYGGLLSYGIAGEDSFQLYFPDNAADSIANSRRLHYRTGRNGGWSSWRTVVDMVGDTLTIVEGPNPKIVVRGSAGYGSPSSASIELVGDADGGYTQSYRWISNASDWAGQEFRLERKVNNSFQLVGRVPKNTNNLEWQGTIVQGLSDSRVKSNVVSMTGGLDKIDQIRPVTFDWVPTENVSDREGADFGFIAQELEEVLPEVVHTRGDGYKTVMYEKVVPVLVQAMKEQQAMIDALKAEIELLKNK